MDAKIFRVNYKSDFILTLTSDAGWMTPFCIKFWTGSPMLAYYASYDGTTHVNCTYDPAEPTKLTVQFDDHRLPIGNLKYQVAYHFTVADFPENTEDEVTNQANVTTVIDGDTYQVMLDLNGETAPEIQFALPAYANELQRIQNEQTRIAQEQQRVTQEQTRINQEAARVTEFNGIKAEALADHQRANEDHSRAQADHQNALADRSQAASDHSRAQSDHSTASSDHSQANSDHSRAQSDHNTALSDHQTALSDHTRAESDHTRATADSSTAAADHRTASDDHTRANTDHGRAESDHQRVETDLAEVEEFSNSLGAYDISAAHATGSTLATYPDLATALGTNGSNIPEALRKGGMSVKFVQTYDNNSSQYVQYMYKGTAITGTPNPFLDVANWEKIDLEGEVKQLDREIYGDSNQYSINYSGEGTAINISYDFELLTHSNQIIYIKATDNENQIPSLSLNAAKSPSGFVSLGSLAVDNQWHGFDVPGELRSSLLIIQYSGSAAVQAGTLNIEYLYHNGIEHEISELQQHLTVTDAEIININTNVNKLDEKKLDKIIGTNLIDPDKLTFKKAIDWNGHITDVGSSSYCISDYIPVNGQDIISNAMSTQNSWSAYAVFDENKVLLRSGQSNQQYTYQRGDYYVVFSWAATSAIRTANYGDELKVEPFTDFAPLTNLEKIVETFTSSILEIPNKVDKVIGTNIINPSEVISGAALPYNSTDGVPTTGLASHYCVTGYIPINGQSIISNAFSSANTWATMFIYGATKNFLRSNGTNQQYTYQEGDYFVRISYNTSTVSNQKANYGTTLLPYEPYTEFKPIQDVQNTINMVASETGESYKETNIIDVGEGYTYTDIQPAIESITDASATNRYLIRIHDDYNITDVTKLWLFSNPLSHASGINASCAFIITKSFVDLCGAGRRVKISVKLPAVDSSSAQQLNCHCVYESGDIRISNIEFESEYTRYTLHEENGGGSLSNANSNKKKVFKNVVLRYLKGTKYNAALGIGTAPGEDCLYENCVIESYAVNGSIKDGVGNLHSHPNYAYPFKYVFRNCIISTANYNNSTIYTDIRSGVKPTFVFEGCNFGNIRDFRSPTGLGGISLSDKAADWRNGGFYLEGYANRGVLGRTTVPCLYLSSTDNDVNVNVVGGTAYSLIFGDAVVNYPGTSDAKGVYLGSQYILANSVWSLQERLGNCSSENKTLIVSVGGVEQTISLNQDYSSLSDADIIADINSKLSGCSVAKDMLYQQLHWSDNVKLIINTGSETIKVNSILTDNGGLHNVKLANSGDIAVGIATERINPGATGLMIVKSEQYMQGSGVSYNAVVGTKYKCGDGGVLVTDNTDAAQFVCVNETGIFTWI